MRARLLRQLVAATTFSWLLCRSAFPEMTDLPVGEAHIHRPPGIVDRESFAAVREGVTVLAQASAQSLRLADSYVAALRLENLQLPESLPLVIITAGPMLDSPDQVAVRSLVRRTAHIDLEIVYSSARLRDEPLLRNVRWRPLVEVPLSLPVGQYDLRCVWRAVAHLSDSTRADGHAVTHKVRLKIHP